MTGATPAYGLPYPTASDRLDAAVTTIPQSLATQLETTLQGFGGIANPGGWTAPALSAPFGNFGAGFRNVRYRKVGNLVVVQGVMGVTGAIGASAVPFTLPVGFRPLQSHICCSFWSSGAFRWDVNNTGQLVTGSALAVGQFVSLDGVSFYID